MLTKDDSDDSNKWSALKALTVGVRVCERGALPGVHLTLAQAKEAVDLLTRSLPTEAGLPPEPARYSQMGSAMVETHNTFDGKPSGAWIEAKDYDTLRAHAEGLAADAVRTVYDAMTNAAPSSAERGEGS